MKTIVRKQTNVSLYLLPDNMAVKVGDSMTQVGDPAEFMIADCNASNCVVHENVPDPGDWSGWKYLFDGTAWTPNPDWVDPAASEVLDSAR
jgi:hypothetical protein